ncbi:Lrp/AsnC family transcriptional regulator [Dongia sedimenti]|uniref:Lrp/AsnC family transcriptional regulator n=1 Tax=Dongia sedimenti TaxID=3064282 RepID=A0ABU0YR97_9PROT|nr:Lrp/AsnC family transcriptional regulator [Rhodospirillaceae bacterium R-7]
MLDDIDRALLQVLQRDGQTSYAELGSHVGLSASAVNDRLKRLKGKGVLQRITAEVSAAALGREFLVFILVELGDLKQEPEFLDRMRACREVLECHHIAGDYSYLLKLRLTGTGHLERFLSTQVKSIGGIQRTHSIIALSTVKETREVDVSAVGGS